MILVTGAAGFIGSMIVRELNERGTNKIILCDHFGSGDKWKNLKDQKFHSFIQVEDLLNHPIWDNPTPFSAIYHMGACSDTTEEDMDFLYKNNTEFTNSILSLATKKDIPIVYASSAATYGDGALGYSDDHGMVSKLRPLNKYGYSKQLSDEWILNQDNKPRTWFGVKFFNVFGPNEYHKGKMSSVVFQAYNQINKTGAVKLFKSHKEPYKDGEQLRDFVYVKDVVNAMLSLVEKGIKDSSISGIYNLGTGEARSFLDLARATFLAMDISSKIEFIEMPENLQNQYQYHTEADMNKLKRVLPDFKFTSLEEAIKDYVQGCLRKDF